MQIIDLFLTDFSFDVLVSKIFEILGLGNSILIIAGLISFIAYIITIPSKGPFEFLNPRMAILFYSFQVFNIFSLFFIIPMLITKSITTSEINFLINILVLLIPIWLAFQFSGKQFSREISFDEQVRYLKSKKNMSFYFNLLKKDERFKNYFRSVAFIWIVLPAEIIYLLIYNPSLPLFGWIYFFFIFIYLIFFSALYQGSVMQLNNTRYVRIETSNEVEIEGFLIGNGEDHYVIRRKEGDIIIEKGFIRTISPIVLHDFK